MKKCGGLSIGVVMCVYNGAKYLQDQLNSIAGQTLLPTSMVILDDGSSDGSWDLLTQWVSSVPFPVRLTRNLLNLGVVRSFERACSLVEGDLIFLTDQDDIWYPEKLRIFSDAFAADSDMTLLHCDADLIDANNKKLGKRLFESLLVTVHERELVKIGFAWQVYAKRNLVTGAACAFRRELLDFARPFSPMWLHDEWLAFHAALVGRVGILSESVMAYRLHGSNTVGLPLPTFAWRVRTTIQAFTEPTAPRQLKRAQRLDEIVAVATRLVLPQGVIDHLISCANHARFRASLPRNPLSRLVGVLRESRSGNYNAWSNGLVSMLHDLLIAR